MAGSVNFAITYKQGGFKLVVYSDANWGNNPYNAKSMCSYIVMLANCLISLNVGLQRLTAQSIMEAELVSAVLTMKDAVFFSNMMGLGFEKGFSSVMLHLVSTSPLYVASDRT